MNISRTSRVWFFAAFWAIMLGSASCVEIDETLGENFIPTDQIWDVYPCESQTLTQITMRNSDKLSGYSTSRFTFGAVKDENFVTRKMTSFTLVPLDKNVDFGKSVNGYPKVTQFHLSAVRDTLSMVFDNQERILQNVYVQSLKAPLDSNVLYTDTQLKTNETIISLGIPVYDGGDSLSFDFSIEYANSVIKGIQDFQSEETDSLNHYLKHV